MEFTIMKQGYNRYEVDTYIKKLEAEIEDITLKLNIYKTKTDELLEAKNEIYSQLLESQQTLKIREKASEDLSKIAIREANSVIAQAQKNSEFIIQEAFVSARLILLEVSKLGETTNELKGQLKERIDKLNELVTEMKDFPTIDQSKLK